MNSYAFEIPSIVIATLTLSASALAASLLLWKLKPSSPRIHRFVWLAVLLNGVILWRFPIDLPVLDPLVFDQTHLSNTLNNELDNSKTPNWIKQGQDASAIQSADRARQKTLPIQSNHASAEPIGDQFENAEAPAVNPRQSHWFPAWQTVLFGLWLAGAAITVLILIRRYFEMLVRLSSSQPAEISWQSQLDQVVHEFNYGKNVPLLVHQNLGPLLIATPLQSRIVVPCQFWQQLSPLQRRAILSHEIAHLVRRDIWSSMFAAGLATVHWFNPLSWIALRHFNQAAEWACDQHAGSKDSPERTGFARALLSLSAGDTRFLVGASGIASTNLMSRVERLLVSRTDDTVTRKMLVVLLIGTIALMGWFNVRFVTADPPVSSVSIVQADEDDTKALIRTLSERLEISNDELTKEFVAAANTPAGMIAVANRVGVVRNQMRKEASRSVIAEYFANQLQGDFLRQMTEEVEFAKTDIETMNMALDELRSRLSGDSEADQLLARLLKNENAAGVLYFSQFRNEIRPGKRQVLERLGRFLARDGKGNFIVRESVEDDFISQLQEFADIDKHLENFGKELRNWSDEVVPKDDMHKRVKTGLARPESAAHILAAIQGEGEIQERIEQYFRFLEQILVDTSEGLVIREDQREFLKTAIASADLQIKKIDLLRRPVREIANTIEVRGEAERLAKEFMLSEFGLTVLVKDIDAGMTSPESIADKIKMQVLEETGDGKLRVREDRQEQVTKFAREMLANTRRIRRRTMILDETIENLEDESLKSICDSIEGRMILIEDIKEHADSLEYDAWTKWVETVFEESENGLIIRPEGQPEISAIIEAATKIGKEMQKDDF